MEMEEIFDKLQAVKSRTQGGYGSAKGREDEEPPQGTQNTRAAPG